MNLMTMTWGLLDCLTRDVEEFGSSGRCREDLGVLRSYYSCETLQGDLSSTTRASDFL
jgi:hypothetical protein